MSIKTEGKIGNREQMSILMICIGLKLADTTPALLYSKTKTASWMVPLLSIVIILPFFVLTTRVVSHFKDKNIIEVFYSVFGNYIGFFMSFGVFLMNYFIILVDLRDYVDSVSVMYFPGTPVAYLLLLFLAGCLIVSLMGIQALSSAFYISLPYIKLVLLLLIILISQESEWKKMFPFFGGGIDQILIQGVNKAGIFTDLFLLLAIYPELHKKENFKKMGILVGIFVALEISTFILMYTLLFEFPFIERITYPFHEITKYIKLGNFATHIESFFLYFWLMAATFRFAFYLYTASVIFKATFKLEEENKLVIFPITASLLSAVLIIENSTQNIFFMKKLVYHSISYISITLPIFLWAVFKIRRMDKK